MLYGKLFKAISQADIWKGHTCREITYVVITVLLLQSEAENECQSAFVFSLVVRQSRFCAKIHTYTFLPSTLIKKWIFKSVTC